MNVCRESTSLPHQVNEGSADMNFTQGSQKPCEKESRQRKKVSDKLQKKSKLDSEIVHISNSSKDPHDRKVSNNTNKSNRCSEQETGESKKVTDNLKKKSKLDYDIEHISISSKEESHDSEVSKNVYKSNQCSSTLEPISKVADVVDQKVKEIEISIGNSNSDNIKQEDMNGSCKAELSNLSNGTNNNSGIDKQLVCSQKENQNGRFQTPIKIYYKRRSTSTNSINSKVN